MSEIKEKSGIPEIKEPKSIYPQVQIRLYGKEKFFGPGPCRLLELIDETGSIQEACIAMNLSYSKGSRLVKLAEQQLGYRLIDRKSGGTGGGGSRLTEEGSSLMKRYRGMEQEVQEQTEVLFRKYFG